MEHPHLRVQCRFLVEFGEWLEEEFKWSESADTEHQLPAGFKTHQLPMRCIRRLADLRRFRDNIEDSFPNTIIRDSVYTPDQRGTIMKDIERFLDAAIRTMEKNSAQRALAPGQIWGALSDREVKKGGAKKPGVQVPFAAWLLENVFCQGKMMDEGEWELLESCSDPAWRDLRKRLEGDGDIARAMQKLWWEWKGTPEKMDAFCRELNDCVNKGGCALADMPRWHEMFKKSYFSLRHHSQVSSSHVHLRSPIFFFYAVRGEHV